MTTQGKAYLYAISTVLLWSTVATAFKISLRYMEPLQLLFYANLTSVLFLFTVLLVRGQVGSLTRVGRKKLFHAAILGLLNPLLYYWVLFKAYDLLPAQEAQPLNYTWAITLSILAIPLLKQKLRPIDLIAILTSYFGILVIATHGDPLSLHFTNAAGVLLALASTLIWAVYWIYNTRSTLEPVKGLFLNFLFALPFVGVLTWVTHGFVINTSFGIAGALYVGLFEMGIAFVFWLNAMRLTKNTAEIANLIYFAPIISLFLIHFIVGEIIHWSSGVGLLLIILGNLLQHFFKRSRRVAGPVQQTTD